MKESRSRTISRSNYNGILTLIGGIILNTMFGTLFISGTINVYIVSYFRQFDNLYLSYDLGGIIFPLMMTSIALGLPIGIYGIRYTSSVKIVSLVFTSLSSMMLYIASTCEVFQYFIIFYSILFGFFIGCAQFVPIYLCFVRYPNYKGFISGLIACSYGLCQPIFGSVLQYMVNPNNIDPEYNADDDQYYYEGVSIDVARNVPFALRQISYIYMGMAICGSLLLNYHKDEVELTEERLQHLLKKNVTKRESLLKTIKKLQQAPIPSGVSHLVFDGLIKSAVSLVDMNTNLNQKKNEVIKKKLGFNKYIIKESSLNHQKTSLNSENQIQESMQPVNTLPIIMESKSELNDETNIDSRQSKKIEKYNKNIDIYCNQASDNEKNIDLDNNHLHNHNIEKKIEKLLKKQEKYLKGKQNKDEDIKQYLDEHQITVERIKKEINEKELFISQQMDLIMQKENYLSLLVKQGAPNISLALKQKQLWMSTLLSALTIGYSIYVNANFWEIAKQYGLNQSNFPLFVGLISGLVSSVSKPLWGSLQEKSQFKNIITFILIVEIISSLTFKYSKNSQMFFLIQVIIAHLILAGILAIQPVQSIQLNGVLIGSQIFGLYWYAYSVANFIQFLLVLFLRQHLGYDNIFYIYTGIACLSILIARTCDLNIDWSSYYRNRSKYILEEQEHKPTLNKTDQLFQLSKNIHTDNSQKITLQQTQQE